MAVPLDENLLSMLPIGALSRTPEMTPGVILPGYNDRGMPSGGQSPWAILQTLLPLISSLTGNRFNFTPLLAGRDQNVYDLMLRRQFLVDRTRVLQEATALDRPAIVNLLRGLAHMTGTPWGTDQQLAATRLVGSLSTLMPTLAATAPDFLEMMGGRRGSGLVMTQALMDTSRYRIDPVTGLMGMDPSRVGALSRRLYEHYFDPTRPVEPVLSAGRTGQLLGVLQQQGLIGALSVPGMTGFRGRLAASVEELQAANRETEIAVLRSAARTARIDLGTTNQEMLQRLRGLSADDMDRLFALPEAKSLVQAGDAQRYIRAIDRYKEAVDVMREIFGAADRPDAPVPDLIKALDSLTQGGLVTRSPTELRAFATRLQAMQGVTGMTLLDYTAQAQQAQMEAASVGLDPFVGSQLAMDAGLYTAAFRNAGPGVPFRGRLTAEQFQDRTRRNLIGAAASRAAERLGVLEYFADQDQVGADSDLRRMIEAVRAGATEFTDASGQRRSIREVLESDSAAFQMLRAAGVTLSEQEFTELRSSPLVRQGREAEHARYLMAFQREERLKALREDYERHTGLMTALQNLGLSPEAARRVLGTFITRMAGAGGESWAKLATRKDAQGELLRLMRESLPADVAQQLDKDEARQRALGTSLFAAFAAADPQRQLAMFQEYDPNVMATQRSLEQQTKLDERMRTALRPLNRMTIGQRLVDSIIGAKPGESVWSVLNEALFINEPAAKPEIQAAYDRLIQKREALRQKINRGEAVPDSDLDDFAQEAAKLQRLLERVNMTDAVFGGGRGDTLIAQARELAMQPLLTAQIKSGEGAIVGAEDIRRFREKRSTKLVLDREEDVRRIYQAGFRGRIRSRLEEEFKKKPAKEGEPVRVAGEVIRQKLADVLPASVLSKIDAGQVFTLPALESAIAEWAKSAAQERFDKEKEALDKEKKDKDKEKDKDEKFEIELRTDEEVAETIRMERERAMSGERLKQRVEYFEKQFGATRRMAEEMASMSIVMETAGVEWSEIEAGLKPEGKPLDAIAAHAHLAGQLRAMTQRPLTELKGADLRKALTWRRDRVRRFLEQDYGAALLTTTRENLQEMERTADQLLASGDPYQMAQGVAIKKQLGVIYRHASALNVDPARLLLGDITVPEGLTDQQLEDRARLIRQADEAVFDATRALPEILQRGDAAARGTLLLTPDMMTLTPKESAQLNQQIALGLDPILGQLPEAQRTRILNARASLFEALLNQQKRSQLVEQQRINVELLGRATRAIKDKSSFKGRLALAAAEFGLHSDQAMEVMFGDAWRKASEKDRQAAIRALQEGTWDKELPAGLRLTADAEKFMQEYKSIASEAALHELAGISADQEATDDQKILMSLLLGGARPMLTAAEAVAGHRGVIPPLARRMIEQMMLAKYREQLVEAIKDQINQEKIPIPVEQQQALFKQIRGQPLTEAEQSLAQQAQATWSAAVRAKFPMRTTALENLRAWTGAFQEVGADQLDPAKLMRLHEAAQAIQKHTGKESLREAFEDLQRAGDSVKDQTLRSHMDLIREHFIKDGKWDPTQAEKRLLQTGEGASAAPMGEGSFGHLTISGRLRMEQDGAHVALEGTGRLARA